ncbi:MAG TPA: helix-turn-helix domain-containing protein [Ktedonobacterales bacterium]
MTQQTGGTLSWAAADKRAARAGRANPYDPYDPYEAQTLDWRSMSGPRVSYNIACHFLMIDQRIVALSPTQSRLAIALLCQFNEAIPSRQLLLAAFPSDRMSDRSDRMDEDRDGLQRLHRHMNELRRHLTAFDLRIAAVYGYGYMLMRARTMERDRTLDPPPAPTASQGRAHLMGRGEHGACRNAAGSDRGRRSNKTCER